MKENRADDSILAELQPRIITLEAEVRSLLGAKKILISIAGFLIVQAFILAVVIGRYSEKMDDLVANKVDVSTALAVLADHGTELENVRSDTARIQGVTDSLYQRLLELSGNRFYKDPDGVNLEARVKRLEDYHIRDVTP
jgi:hypothetical protein